MLSGNAVTAMLKMHQEVYRPALNDARIADLVKYRGIPDDAFRTTTNLGYDPIQCRYVWLVSKPNGMPNSLRTFVLPKKKGKNAVRAMKGAKLGLLGGEQLGDESRKHEPVFICEGEWDFHALSWVLMEAGQNGIVTAVPGAGVFNKDWAGWFANREVIVCFDCDEAGRTGSVRIYEKLRGVAKDLKFLHWPRMDQNEENGRPDGFDVHDLVREYKTEPQLALTFIQKHLKITPTGELTKPDALVGNDDRRSKQEDLDPIGIQELYDAFDKWLLLSNHDLIDITMGVLWTLHLPGNPLWMFIIAPPSGSKSETLMPASAWWRCHALSNMTSKSLISGFKGPGDSDPSLFAALDGQRAAIAIKDMTPLLQGNTMEREEVFGILRDAYDGSVSKSFGNGIRRDYKKLHFTMLVGVTPAIDAAADTSMGERFLKFRADRDLDRSDDIERALRAIQNCGSEDQMREELQDACVRALMRPFDPSMVKTPTETFTHTISILAFCVARLRAVAPIISGTDRQVMHPVIEASPRLATQFVKLAQGLALHFEADSLEDERVLKLVRRVALHTVDTISASIAHVLFYVHCKEGVKIDVICAFLPSLSRDTIRDAIIRYCRLKMLDINKPDGANHYRFTDTLYSVLKKSEIFLHLPPTDIHYKPNLEKWANRGETLKVRRRAS
jgi:hypothetical protein